MSGRTRAPARPGIGHNGGPPLKEPRRRPPWGPGPIGTFFAWKAARRAAWAVSRDVALRRLERAERLGLTYEEYALEILERGRHLQPEDAERVARIKAGWRRRSL